MVFIQAALMIFLRIIDVIIDYGCDNSIVMNHDNNFNNNGGNNNDNNHKNNNNLCNNNNNVGNNNHNFQNICLKILHNVND